MVEEDRHGIGDLGGMILAVVAALAQTGSDRSHRRTARHLDGVAVGVVSGSSRGRQAGKDNAADRHRGIGQS